MHNIDLAIFIIYILVMLGIGVYFYRKNQSIDDYFVGGRKIGSWHIGLSVVATDVGGGFSIGLGGLGFTMGLSGSWMLFTGLIGAWVSAVFLIPKISDLSKRVNLFTFPQLFGRFYDAKTAFLAALISVIGYIGFTSSQILAGAKLATATFDGFTLTQMLIAMGVLTVIYTAIGGLKAVIFTDTIQWLILMGGLLFVGLPVAYHQIGGYEAIKAAVPSEMLSFSNLSWSTMVNWSITIIPIWFVGMTLYQRIFACKNEKEAKKAWFIAGLFEWPIMAFLGVVLGLFAKVAVVQGLIGGAETIDAELGLPLLLKNVLPVGVVGLLLSAYFSAIMSTADSCLMAASGNIVTDLLGKMFRLTADAQLRMSQLTTLLGGALAIYIALQMQNVLALMLLSYSFMVSGLFIPIMGALFWKKSSANGAFIAMLGGGITTSVLILLKTELPLELDPNFYGMLVALFLFVVFSYLLPNRSQLKVNL